MMGTFPGKIEDCINSDLANNYEIYAKEQFHLQLKIVAKKFQKILILIMKT